MEADIFKVASNVQQLKVIVMQHHHMHGLGMGILVHALYAPITAPPHAWAVVEEDLVRSAACMLGLTGPAAGQRRCHGASSRSCNSFTSTSVYQEVIL